MGLRIATSRALSKEKLALVIGRHLHLNGSRSHRVDEIPWEKECRQKNSGTALVEQCLRIYVPMQGTQVRSLLREDPTCRGLSKPVRHNY